MCNVISEKKMSSLNAPIIIIIIIIIIMYFLQIVTRIRFELLSDLFYLKLIGSIFFVYIIII